MPVAGEHDAARTLPTRVFFGIGDSDPSVVPVSPSFVDRCRHSMYARIGRFRIGAGPLAGEEPPD